MNTLVGWPDIVLAGRTHPHGPTLALYGGTSGYVDRETARAAIARHFPRAPTSTRSPIAPVTGSMPRSPAEFLAALEDWLGGQQA